MAREMKDSGVEWIGKIPKKWKSCKLLYCLRQPICDGPHETPNFVEQGIPFISVDSLNDTKNINLDIVKKFISEEDYNNYMTKAELEKGDILFSKSATIGKTAIVGNEKFMIWSPLAVLKSLPEKCNRNYLYYLLNCRELITAIKLSGTYNTQANVGMRQIEKAKIPLPPLIVQEKITNYLDKKVADIDLIIEKTKATIEDYKKYKQSIITEAVIKGLNPDVEMKDSGIEWIGQIPKHWKKINPKALFYQRKDRAKKDDRQLTASQKYGIMYQDEFMEKEGVRVTVVQKDFDILKHVEPNDFVISMRSFQGGLEYSELSGCISSAYVMLIPNLDKVYPKFFKFFFKSFKYINALQSTSNLVRDGQAMRYSNFSQLYLVEIPLEEQKEIAEYLDKKIAEIDNLIAKKESLISEMEEYKKSLIYECVTGKKEII